ncbi:MAG TPA: pyridoxamine 5'-phosphate oxidase family protein [Candidatus Pristimantibacillus sp.]|jgi:uncharacterized pyridoxamine 5'-phosphate oxidase family protein|nr:pyridoxamine 5'-phosphate oxidase family protein [Candidatus Pristimantibacillus sp.]
MDETDPNYTKIMDYIARNPAAVLGTVDDEGPHGAVVYVIPASHGTICFVTKSGTKKYQNLTAHPKVSLTFFNERESTTLQASGHAYVADDSNGLKDLVMDKVTKAHAMVADWLPPVTKVQSGEYAVIGIELDTARLADYGSIDINGPVFTELKAH